MLIDTHVHLTDSRYDQLSPDFAGLSVADIIKNMSSDGLARMISIGYDVSSSEASKKIAQANDYIYFAAGIHPSESAKTTAEDLAKIEELCKAEKCVAIGEIGLDYHYDDTDKPSQLSILIAQMQIAKRHNLPVIFHVRDAAGDMMKIIKENLGLLPQRGVMHCYSGSLEDAREYIKMGFYISFSGSLTFKNAVNLQGVAVALPRDKVLIETDCPYLAPTPNRGKTNYPSYVSLTAIKLAELWQTTLAEVAKITTENAQKLFTL